MQDYDVTLKALISSSAAGMLRQLGVVGPIRRWLNVELPKVQNQRVDLLAELGSGDLLHLELQSSNFMQMPLRMLEYGVGIWRVKDVFPRQIVLYVGNDPLRMQNGFKCSGIDYRFHLVDIRDLDSEVLLESESVSDNVLALLTTVDDKVMTLRRIIGKIGRLEPERKAEALRKVLILCGMRGLVALYRQEEKNMPVDFDIMDHELFGPAIRQGMEEGRREEAKKNLRCLIERRFGPVPPWVDQRLIENSLSQTEDLYLRILDAKSLEELFA